VRHTYFVPVHSNAPPTGGTLALRTGRLPSGERIGLAFTSEASLLLTLGPCQEWLRFDIEALRDMLTPLGVEHIRVDPRPAADGLPSMAAPALAASASPKSPRDGESPAPGPAGGVRRRASSPATGGSIRQRRRRAGSVQAGSDPADDTSRRRVLAARGGSAAGPGRRGRR
jgi:hypothetical protein